VRLHTADHARPWRIPMLPLLALVAGALALAGCGSSKSTSSSASTPPAAAPTTTQSTAASPPTTTSTTTQSTATSPAAPAGALSLAANPEGQLKYDTTSLVAKAGKVAITFTNNSSLSHNVTVESSGSVVGTTPTFQGGSKALTLDLKPGTYKFYCSVPGHRQAGMEGTLVVK
jgi:plastocyanin